MRNRVITLLTFLFLAYQLPAQTFWESYHINKKQATRSFSEVEMEFRNWALSHDLKEIKGWKYLGRWLDFQTRRLDGSGHLPSAKSVQQGISEAMEMRKQAAAKTSGNNSWVPYGPFNYPAALNSSFEPGMGRTNCITFHPSDPNTYWVGVAQGGVWKTTDDGANWTPLTDDLPMIRVSDIAVNPSNPDEMYISMGDYAYIGVALETDDRKRHTHYGLGVYKTLDGGQTWSPTGLSFANTDFDGSLTRRVLVNPAFPTQLVAAGTHGLWKSYDSGANWVQISDSLFWDLEMDPNNPSTLYATTGWVANLNEGSCAILKSTNFGTSWTTLPTGIPAQGAAQRIEVAVSPANSSYVYAIACGLDRGLYAVYRSTNGGTSWTQTATAPNILHWYEGLGSGGQGTYDLVLLPHPTDVNTVYAGGINLWGSTDGGYNWNGVSYWRNDYGQSIHADQHQFKYNPLSSKYFICNDGGVYNTSTVQMGDWNNAGNPGFTWPTTWTRKSGGMNVTSFYEVGISENYPGRVIAGAQDNSTYYYDGNSWVNIIGGDGMDCFLHPSQSGTLWGSSQYGNLANSYDGGFTINYGLNSGIPEPGEWVTPWMLDKTDPSRMYAGFGNVWMSNDDGFSWQMLSNFPSVPGLGAPNLCSALNVSEEVAGGWRYIYAAKRIYHSLGQPSSLVVSTNSGATWNDVTNGLPDSLYFTHIEIDADDPATAWVACGGFASGKKLYKTTNAGANWTNVSLNLPNLPVNCVIEHDGMANNPVYVGTDVGVYYINDTLTNWIPYMDDLPSVIVGDLEIHPGEEKIYAATFGRGLWQANLRDAVSSGTSSPVLDARFEVAPNPNAGAFQVRLEGFHSEKVQMDVLDVQGKAVWNRDLPVVGGQLIQEFNLNFPAGLYFVRISDGTRMKSRRVVIQ